VYSLPTELKAPGLSFKTVLDNLLGFVPAPYIYGIVYESTKDKTPKLSMQIMFLYTGVGSLLIFIGLIMRYKKFSDEEKELREFHENIKNRKNTNSNDSRSINNKQEDVEDLNETSEEIFKNNKNNRGNGTFSESKSYNSKEFENEKEI